MDVLTEPSAHPESRRECAGSKFVGRHQTTLWRYLCFLGCPLDAAEDYMQDAFLVALEHGITSRADATAAAWLRTTVRNLFLGDLRAAARKPARAAFDLAQLDANWHQHGNRYVEYLEALRHCLPHLDEQELAAVEQRYRYSWSRQRMADSLGLTVDGVKSLLRRIRGRLRREVERRLEENER